MSRTSTGKKKSGPPAHQNSVAWKPDPRSGLAKRIAALPTGGFCRRCNDIVEFKKRVGQYKPLKDKKKWWERQPVLAGPRSSRAGAFCSAFIVPSIVCGEKQVAQAYHVICPACATPENSEPLCGKCREPLVDPPAPSSGRSRPTPKEAEAERQGRAELDAALKLVSERKRRTILRRLERGDLDLAGAKELAEKHRKKDGLEDFFDDLDFGDDFSDDEESASEDEKKPKKGGKVEPTKVPANGARTSKGPMKSAAAKQSAESEEDSEEEEDDFDSEESGSEESE
ncbi:hypothetical protein DFJ74DRAFT_671977 [Hyaloraphidium curvatum]|nr:hypothetical protein DFJ74DRAFT_671977 [Hyaloraphidium curvatum]